MSFFAVAQLVLKREKAFALKTFHNEMISRAEGLACIVILHLCGVGTADAFRKPHSGYFRVHKPPFVPEQGAVVLRSDFQNAFAAVGKSYPIGYIAKPLGQLGISRHFLMWECIPDDFFDCLPVLYIFGNSHIFAPFCLTPHS